VRRRDDDRNAAIMDCAMELVIEDAHTPHPDIVSHALEPPRVWHRPSPRVMLDLRRGPSVRLLNAHHRIEPSRRSLDTFRNARLVWSDCFVVGQRFESAYADRNRFQAWALGARDAGTLAQRTATLTWADDRLLIDDAKLCDAREVDAPVYFATPQEPHNWGLWLLASVPAIAHYRAHRGASDRLFAYAHHPNMAATYGLLGIDADWIIPHDVFSTYHLRSVKLYRAGAMDCCITDWEKSVFAAMVRRGESGSRGGYPTRLFVSRRHRSSEPAAPRRLVNEPELATAFERLGFSVIEPEQLSLVEQIRHFSAARMVAGPGGAGMFNAVFCRPGTRLLSIEDSDVFLNKHANIFASMTLEYGFVIGTQAASPNGATRLWQVNIPAVLEAAMQLFAI
jgi:hypothetical protein